MTIIKKLFFEAIQFCGVLLGSNRKLEYRAFIIFLKENNLLFISKAFKSSVLLFPFYTSKLCNINRFPAQSLTKCMTLNKSLYNNVTEFHVPQLKNEELD